MTSEFRVLHVDDEPVICDLTRHCLEKNGRFKVDVVNSAEEALNLIKTGSYSCIISDYEMPCMNGLDFLKAIREIDSEIPFILFSGRGREAVIIDAINTGADFYIQKGGDAKALFAELNHKVEYAIEQRNTRLALKRRDGILEAVSLVANLFLGGNSFNRTIQEAITLFGLATEVDAVRLFRLDGGETTRVIHNVASWIRIEVNSPDNEEKIRTQALQVSEDLLRRLKMGEPVLMSSEEIIRLDPCLKERPAKAVAIFSIFVDQSLWGMIRFADFLSERKWTGVEVDALLAASAMIGSAIQQDLMRMSLVRAKEEYASMYALMRRLCDSVPDLLWAKDMEDKYLFINQAGSHYLHAGDTRDPVGKKDEDFPDRLIHARTEDDDRSSGIRDLMEHERIRIKKDSGQVILDMTTVPLWNSEEERIGSVTLGRDITKYCRIEARLRNERERYEKIIQNIHIGIIILDRNEKILVINPRGLELIGKTWEECEGEDLRKIPVFREMEISPAIQESLQSGKDIPVIGPGKLTGLPADLHCMIHHLHQDNGDPAEILISLDLNYP
ncbi:MAG: response regulator [Methanospirillum sp.]|nr:response regulator [Methanospirillum sp.]